MNKTTIITLAIIASIILTAIVIPKIILKDDPNLDRKKARSVRSEAIIDSLDHPIPRILTIEVTVHEQADGNFQARFYSFFGMLDKVEIYPPESAYNIK